METIYLDSDNLGEWQQNANSNVMALGFFDGIHYGHLEVIQTAKGIAKDKNLTLSVMSFFPHPKVVISHGKEKVNYLMPITEKEKILESLGVDTFYIVNFDKTFASLSPEEFVADYLSSLGVVHAVAGFDFTYGRRGLGNLNRLKQDSGGHIDVTTVEKVECEGGKISSTHIREMLLQGKVEELPNYLGRYYEVECEWKDHSIKALPLYTLPAPGHYSVILKKGNKLSEEEVIVKRVSEGCSLQFVTKVSIEFKGQLSIIWKKCYSLESVARKELVFLC